MKSVQITQALTLTQRIISESHNSSPMILPRKGLGRHKEEVEVIRGYIEP